MHSFAFNLYASNEDGTSRDPFLVKDGDSLSNNVSDVPAIQVSGGSTDVTIDYAHPVDWETVVSRYSETYALNAVVEDYDLITQISDNQISAEIDEDLVAVREDETLIASVC